VEKEFSFAVETYEGQKIVIRFDDQHTTPLLDASAIDLLIQGLAQVRAEMQPPIRESDPQTGDKVVAMLDPRFHIAYEEFVGGAVVQFRHPGFGWLPFALPLESLRDATRLLQQVLVEAESNTQGKPLN
jgi:hypothetical protein